jgi:hypothetical protein
MILMAINLLQVTKNVWHHALMDTLSVELQTFVRNVTLHASPVRLIRQNVLVVFKILSQINIILLTIHVLYHVPMASIQILVISV